MIKINLLEQRKKTKKRADKGQQTVLLGLLIVIAVGFVTFWFVHRPLVAEVDRLEDRNGELRRKNKKIQKKTKNFNKLQQAVQALKERQAAIERLRDARAVPAWMLWELSNILTRPTQPSTTPEMERRLKTDPNREFRGTWDPKKLWITNFEERNGKFTLEGAAQSDSDMTQLALRMKASVFFDDVQPEEGKEVTDSESGLTYYTFTLTGKVRY